MRICNLTALASFVLHGHQNAVGVRHFFFHTFKIRSEAAFETADLIDFLFRIHIVGRITAVFHRLLHHYGTGRLAAGKIGQ